MAGDYARLITYFIGRDEMTPALNEINGSLTNTGRRLEDVGRRGAGAATMMGREWDRFRRHFGYATAGLATYEIFNAIGRLRDYQNEVAQLNATLGATPSQLQEFSRAAFDISTRTGTALDDVFQSMQNIINSFPQMSQQMRAHFVPATAMIEAMGARVSGLDPRAFGATVSTIADAFFGRQQIARQGPALIDRIASEIITVQRRIPNPAGAAQFISSMPTLAQGANTAGFNLEQALALYTIAQRNLGGTRTTAQYLRQLFTRLHGPTRAAQPFFAQAGIGPQELADLTGPQILNRLIAHGLSLPGGIHQDTSATPEEVAQFMHHPSWRRGQVRGQAMRFFQQSIGGRIQSSVAMTAFLQNLQQLPMEQQAIRNAPDLRTRFQQMDISMSQAGQAFANITTEIGTTLLPAINPLAKAMVKLEGLVNRSTDALNRGRNYLNQHSPHVPLIGRRLGDVAEIAAVVAGGIGVNMLQRRGLGRLLGRRLQAPLAAERGLIEAEAAGNALAGVARGTPAAPFWVVIHPLSMSQIPALSGHPFGGGGGTNPLHDPVTDYFGLRALRRAGQRLAGRFGRNAVRNPAFDASWLEETAPSLAAKIGLRVVPGVGAGAMFFSNVAPAGLHYGPNARGMTRVTVGDFSRSVAKNSLAAQFMHQLGGHGIPSGLMNYFLQFAKGQISEGRLDQAITNYGVNTARAVAHTGRPTPLQQAITGMFRLGPGHHLNISRVDRTRASHGFVEATLNLQPTQEFTNLLRPQQVRVKIPISELPAPTHRARTRVPRK